MRHRPDSVAESRGLTLSLTAAPGLPPVTAEPALLGQAFSVILTNALNYIPSGGQVTVTTLTRDVQRQWVGVRIQDTGPGIALEERAHLFERFYRGAVGRESGVAGTGLGLSIAAEIIERHGGQIEVSSTGVPGEGAAFTLWLPVETHPTEDFPT
jgi:signal transduction histidine kinase